MEMETGQKWIQQVCSFLARPRALDCRQVRVIRIYSFPTFMNDPLFFQGPLARRPLESTVSKFLISPLRLRLKIF